MTFISRAVHPGVVALAALAMSVDAGAQTSQPALASTLGGADSGKGNSFIGVAVGRASYGTSCGNVQGLTCSRGTTSYSLTAGNMITDNVGIELSAMNLGNADRAGGSVRARGINLSAVGRLPLGDLFGVEGKIGTTYGITHVSTAQDVGLPSGRDSGFGLGYGVALDVAATHGVQGSVGWEQHDFHFVGQGMSNVRNITLALGYTF